MPGVQKAGAQSPFTVQLTDEAQTALDFGRKKGRLQRVEAGQQGRI
jgi:hypothetical protein